MSFSLRHIGSLVLPLAIAGCGFSFSAIDSYEDAEQKLRSQLLPDIEIQDRTVSDAIATRYSVEGIREPLPDIEDFPLYAARRTPNPNTVYVEIYTSSEKSNANRVSERWLIDIAESFNRQQIRLDSGQVVQVGIRKIASGTAAQLLASGTVDPEGYSPSNDLWVEILRDADVDLETVQPQLVPNTAGFVLQGDEYNRLASDGDLTFDELLGHILAGEVSVGYPNPYTSSTSLNLLYTIFWNAAGHAEDGQPLSLNDLGSPEVNSVFSAFQDNVLITTRTTLDLQEIFVRDPDKLQAFPLEYQNFVSLKNQPEFRTIEFVPFGIPHNNPLIGFDWNTNAEEEALELFGDFAVSRAAQQVAQQQGFAEIARPDSQPPIPSGDLLEAARSYWKVQKEGGRTVYLMVVIDSSGSMEGEPMRAVKEGLAIASTEINAGNYVGMIAFDDRPQTIVPLAPFDQLQHQRFLAGIDALDPDGSTAMYDATMVAIAELMERRAADPDGRFYILLLTDGETNEGLTFNRVQDILEFSDIRLYPIAYGQPNMAELEAIAGLREATVQTGTADNIQTILRGLFQTNL
ncbi:MAG: VWA domain-containing protein [Synechococcus sp.]